MCLCLLRFVLFVLCFCIVPFMYIYFYLLPVQGLVSPSDNSIAVNNNNNNNNIKLLHFSAPGNRLQGDKIQRHVSATVLINP